MTANKTQPAKAPVSELQKALGKARKKRERRLKILRKRDRLVPVLDDYDKLLLDLKKESGGVVPEIQGLSHLTSIFRGTFERVKNQIDASNKTGISRTNAIKRSAGTNFQGLCEYALTKWLDTTSLPLNIQCNAPKAMKDELTIHGTDVAGPFSVEPDIDICIWREGGSEQSPIIILSAKTSLVDRAGQAARWKLYFDIHQTACPHTKAVLDCPIHRTRIKVQTKREVVHAVVTANIYKIDTTLPQGELENGQCKNNTYMFKHKYTTRNDAREVRPTGWASFSEFPKIVEEVFSKTDTPLAADIGNGNTELQAGSNSSSGFVALTLGTQ